MSEEGFGAVLATARLRIVSATQTIISAELDDRAQLASLLDAEVPADWPPEHHDRETLMFWREQLSQPGAERCDEALTQGRRFSADHQVP